MAEEAEVLKVKAVSLALIKMTRKEKLSLVEDSKSAVFVARIGGIVTEYFEFSDKKTGEIRDGFRGIFTLRTMKGETYQGMAAFLPKQLSKGIMDRLKAGDINVQFRNDVFLEASEKSGTGYQWMCEPALTKETQQKADALLADLLSSDLPKQIAAPKKKAA